MARVRKRILDNALFRINTFHDLQLTLDHNSQGYRVESTIRNLSPRLKPREMKLWLEAFEEGMEVEARRLKR